MAGQGGSFQNAVRAVKDKLDIVEIVRRYVDLRQAGGRWVGPCPFHQETKPSFSVNPQEGFFYCFGCQAAGDVIDFHCRINGLDFREGLEQLAAEAGVDLRSHKPDPHAARRKEEKQAVLAMYGLAQGHFQANLKGRAGEACNAYLEKRGLPGEMVERFGLGFALPGWDGLVKFLRAKNVRDQDAAQAGLLIRNERGRIYDRFRNRLIFPISDLSGRVIAFGGRVINPEDEPKYINSSDSAVYKKGDHLYGLAQARKAMTQTRVGLLTEGYMDVLTLHQFGFENACGVLGTALTENQIKRLSGFCTEVVLLFDGDGAGRKAALRSAEMFLLKGLKCRVALMPEGQDVDDLLRGPGPEALQELMDKAPEGLDYSLETVRSSRSPKDMLDWAKSFVAKLNGPEYLAYFVPRIAGGLGLNEADLRRALEFNQGPARGQARQTPQRPGNAQRLDADHSKEKAVVDFSIRHPECMDILEQHLVLEVFASEWFTAFWGILRREGVQELSEQDRIWYYQVLDRREQMRENRDAELDGLLRYLEEARTKADAKDLLDALRKGDTAVDEMELLRRLDSMPKGE